MEIRKNWNFHFYAPALELMELILLNLLTISLSPCNIHFLPLCGKPCVEMVAVMARYNPFAERAGLKKICESKPDKSVLDAVAKLEKLGFTPYLLAVPEYNKRMLKGKVSQVKEILSSFSYPYNRRIAGQHGHFTMEDYRKWLKKAETKDLAQALRRLAHLNQSKVYLFWKKHQP